MKEIRATKDKQYNQRKNELNWYVEEYIKTKESLRNVRKSWFLLLIDSSQPYTSYFMSQSIIIKMKENHS